MLRKLISVANFCRAVAIAITLMLISGSARAQRLLGLDISAWQGNISQTTWGDFREAENRQFVFIRSSRGGTTGFYDQNDADNSNGKNTLSQRYDDPYFVQNINRATAAAIFAGPYHFSRPDIIESTLNSGGIRNSGVDEADHFIQMAGPWMRPGYLVPIHDLEAGDGIRTDNEIAQFSIDFSNRIFERMGIRPGIYVNGNYAANILQTASAALRDQLAKPAALRPSVVAPAYPVLWVARWPNQTNPNAIDVQGTNPKDTFSSFYGPWDDYGVDLNPWAFWQYASTGRLPSFNNGANNLDFDVIRGDIEFLKDQLVPAVWMNNSSGDWSTLANWNSGQTPIAPTPGAGQAIPVGLQTLPAPRLPGAAGTSVTSGQNDTVILERTNANITVTLSSGAHNIRKLYMREALNITGGSLTINYVPTYASNPTYPNAARSGPISAQFSGPVTLGGTGSLNVHTLQVDSARRFTLRGGTLTFKTISLLGASGTTLAVTGPVTINPLANATAIVTNSGSIDLTAGNRTLTIGDGAAEVDLSLHVPIINGALTKAGPGTMRVVRHSTYADGTIISEGRLLVDTTAGSGTGSGPVTVNGGILSGTGIVAGSVIVNSAGTLAPGTASSIGNLTLNTPPTLNGTTVARIDRAFGSDKLTLTAGTLAFGGTLVVSNIGATLIGGETFTIFSAPAYSGNFNTLILPTLDSGLTWDTRNLAVNGTIAVVRGAPAQFASLPIFNGDALTLHLSGQPGATYYVERSTDLFSWLTISTNVAPSTGLFDYVDPNPPPPAAFYKLRGPE